MTTGDIFVLVCLVIGIPAVIKLFVRSYVPSVYDRYVMSPGEPEGYEPVDEPEPRGSLEIPHMNHVEPRSSGSPEPFALALNAEEVAAVGRMIEHNKTAAKPSKSSTIAAGFGVSRGGSQVYQRASAIYDALFGVPAPAVPTAQFLQDDGTLAPPTYPISGRMPARTRAR